MQETNNMLSFLDNYTLDNPDEIAKEIANDFRKYREESDTRTSVGEGRCSSQQYRAIRTERSYLTQEPYRHSNGIRLHFGDKEPFFRTKILYHGGATTNPQEYQQEKST